MRIRLVISITLFISSIAFFLPSRAGASNAYPIIDNYTSYGQGSISQVWGIVQDKHGVFYYASNLGLLKFDGRDWELYTTPLKSPIRSLAIDNSGTIYIGASNEFGYFTPNSSGKYEYISLSDSIQIRNFGEVLKTFIINNEVYFFADHKQIFTYKNSKIGVELMANINAFRAFEVDNLIYLFDEFAGISVLSNGKIDIFDTKINPDKVYFAIPYDKDNLLLGTLKSGLFLYNLENKTWTQFSTEINAELMNGNVYSALILKNKNIAIATLKKGVFILNSNGQLVYSLNKLNGLSSNSAFYLYEDKYTDLWVGQEKGISHIELSIPFLKIANDYSIDGTLQKIAVYNNHFLCGTSSGIFSKPIQNNSNSFIEFKNIDPNYIYNLDFAELEIPGSKNNLFIASCLRNIVWITPDIDIKSIYDLYGCYTIAKSTKVPGRVFLGSPSGIDVLDLQFSHSNLTIKESTKLSSIKESIKTIVTSNFGDLWFRTAYNTIHKITFNKDEFLDDFEIYHYDELNNAYPNIIITSLLKQDNKIIITTSNGIFSINSDQNGDNTSVFKPDYTFGTNYSLDSLQVQCIGNDDYNNFWISTNKGLYTYNNKSNTLKDTYCKRLMDNQIHFIKSVPNYGLCLLSQDELYLSDTLYNKPFDFSFNALIKYALIGNNYKSIYTDGNESSDITISENIPNIHNSISVTYTAPFYHKNESILFATKLEGFDNSWSSFSKQNNKTYTNLPSGIYKFSVKALNIYNIESSVASFSFSISKPWYARSLSMIGYVIIFSILIWGIFVLYTSKFKRQIQYQFQIKQSEKKFKEHEQKIQYHSATLQNGNLEIEKLTLAANKSENAIVIIDSHGDIEWINEGYEKLFGVTLKDLLLEGTKLLTEYVTIPLPDLIKEWIKTDKPLEIEKYKTNYNGEHIWTKTVISPVFNSNKTLNYIVLIETIIEKK